MEQKKTKQTAPCCGHDFERLKHIFNLQNRTRNGGFNGFKCSLSSVMGLDEDEEEEEEGEVEEEEECRCKRSPLFSILSIFFGGGAGGYVDPFLIDDLGVLPEP